jgi:hypothetical protein
MGRNAGFFTDSDYLDKWANMGKSYAKWQNDHFSANNFPPAIRIGYGDEEGIKIEKSLTVVKSKLRHVLKNEFAD